MSHLLSYLTLNIRGFHNILYLLEVSINTFPFICDTWLDTQANPQGFCRVREQLTQV